MTRRSSAARANTRPISNRYAGPCDGCGSRVAAGDGLWSRTTGLQCTTCAYAARGLADPVGAQAMLPPANELAPSDDRPTPSRNTFVAAVHMVRRCAERGDGPRVWAIVTETLWAVAWCCGPSTVREARAVLDQIEHERAPLQDAADDLVGEILESEHERPRLRIVYSKAKAPAPTKAPARAPTRKPGSRWAHRTGK